MNGETTMCASEHLSRLEALLLMKRSFRGRLGNGTQLDSMRASEGAIEWGCIHLVMRSERSEKEHSPYYTSKLAIISSVIMAHKLHFFPSVQGDFAQQYSNKESSTILSKVDPHRQQVNELIIDDEGRETREFERRMTPT